MFLPLMPSVKPVWRLFAATWPAWPPISTPVAPSGKAAMMASAAVLPPAMSSTLTEQLEPSRAALRGRDHAQADDHSGLHRRLRRRDVAGLVHRVDRDGVGTRATASLMQVVCCWTSPLLSQTETSKPYFSAFFWYIFQEKAWDGLSIWATNVSVGFSPVAGASEAGASALAGAVVAAGASALAGAAVDAVEPHAPATRATAMMAAAPRPNRLTVII